MKYFATPQDRAAAQAAYSELKKMLEADENQLPPGQTFHFENHRVTIDLNCSVTKYPGDNNSGYEYKDATQHLYGWAVIAVLLDQAKRPKRSQQLTNIILLAVQRAIRLVITNKQAIEELYQKYQPEIENLKTNLKPRLGKIRYKTRQMVKVNKPSRVLIGSQTEVQMLDKAG